MRFTIEGISSFLGKSRLGVSAFRAKHQRKQTEEAEWISSPETGKYLHTSTSKHTSNFHKLDGDFRGIHS